MAEKLGRFGHHPDPANDFCVEIEVIEGMVYDVTHYDPARGPSVDIAAARERISRALDFTVGGDAIAVSAKVALRKIAAGLSATEPAPVAMPELRWEGNCCYLGPFLMGEINQKWTFDGEEKDGFECCLTCVTDHQIPWCATEPEARAAVEAAVRERLTALPALTEQQR